LYNLIVELKHRGFYIIIWLRLFDMGHEMSMLFNSFGEITLMIDTETPVSSGALVTVLITSFLVSIFWPK